MHTFTNVVTSLFPRYIGATAKYCDQCVCLSVCLSAGVSQKPQAIFTAILRMLRVTVARSCSDGNAICYLLSSFVDGVIFHITVRMGSIKDDEFILLSSLGGVTGMKYAISDCILLSPCGYEIMYK